VREIILEEKINQHSQEEEVALATQEEEKHSLKCAQALLEIAINRQFRVA
jgi:hypothetical protein